LPSGTSDPLKDKNAGDGPSTGETRTLDIFTQNLILGVFVLLSAAKTIACTLVDVEEVESYYPPTDPVDDGSSAKMKVKIEPFKHPYFVAMTGYLGEFLVIAVMYLYYRMKASEMITTT
jgi:hypothetical protein